MNSGRYIVELASLYKSQGIPLSDAVWETALACEGMPYVYGAWDQETCTPSHRKSRNGGSTAPSEEHPTIITACQVLTGKKGSCNGCKWFPDCENVWEFDCRGFTHDMLQLFGINIHGNGCTSQWNDESNWKAKGTIDTIPDDILVCLFVKNGKKMEHTGFGYKTETIECSKGVQHFTERNKKWTHWAVPVGIDGDIPDIKPTLRRGDKGEWVMLLQTQLVNRGYDVGKTGIDGSFGRATEAAVKAFQKDAGLKVDGICGQQTWDAISQDEPMLYTVTIPNLRKTAAETLVGQYPGATMTEQ